MGRLLSETKCSLLAPQDLQPQSCPLTMCDSLSTYVWLLKLHADPVKVWASPN